MFPASGLSLLALTDAAMSLQNPKSDVEESEDGSEGSASGSDNENDASSNASSTTSSKPLRTPTKNLKRKAPSQLTPSKSAKKSTAATPAKRVRPKLTAAAKSRAGNVEQKRSNYKKKRAERFEAVKFVSLSPSWLWRSLTSFPLHPRQLHPTDLHPLRGVQEAPSFQAGAGSFARFRDSRVLALQGEAARGDCRDPGRWHHQR